ncbi:septin-12 isoform X2 [Microtus pennsylvanicus]|uniref:septin-12 isoform X2 n=1 Tax=Microtus pennsylvanicus TaxID=10058 RepID=UPI003F6C0DD5
MEERQSPSPCSSRPSSPRTPPCEMFGSVGIEAVLDQLRIKAMKTGFEFNIMVVVIEEKGLKLKLTVTDTPGFGDQINNDKCWDPILSYINQQYEQYLHEELLITRQRHIPDTRVHCCIYFVPPTGHCLRPLDIEFLRRLCRTVNVVPVIARADSLTIEERDAFRSRIQQNLKTHCIDVYPQKCFDEDINDRLLNSKIRQEQIPFAVVGADREHLVNGRCVLGRKTKWGIIEVENMAHCEFLLLRDLLIRSHLQDLKDITHNVHYENYRVLRLNESHQLPRGPGWVNLAPASPVQLTSPGPGKVRKRVNKDSREDEC